MGRTPYEDKLLLALDRSIAEQHASVESTIQAMLMAVESGWYHHLPGLYVSLPSTFAALVGSPPQSREADR